jgi:undecaprenyl diphosphate synthase
MVFLDTLFPDFDRRHLWQACEIYASRDRRYGGAADAPTANDVTDPEETSREP